MAESAEPLPGLGLTAILVTGARATESARPDRLFEDPFARAFVEAAGAASPTIAEALAQGSPDEAVNQARRDSIAVRTRFCDDYLLAAARSGCRQVVLLAAGLDARAFRLPWPEGVRLWELDMPRCSRSRSGFYRPAAQHPAASGRSFPRTCARAGLTR